MAAVELNSNEENKPKIATKSPSGQESNVKDSLNNKEKCVSWLANIGASTTGTKQELQARIERLSKFPSLIGKLKAKHTKTYTFDCHLKADEIPPVTAKWRVNTDDFPAVNSDLFAQYASKKREGSIGQQKKALQMFSSRKIVNVKTLVDGNVTYVKGMIRKSYGTFTTPSCIVV